MASNWKSINKNLPSLNALKTMLLFHIGQFNEKLVTNLKREQVPNGHRTNKAPFQAGGFINDFSCRYAACSIHVSSIIKLIPQTQYTFLP